MIGIKGVGMTMLARFLSGQGKIVSGSDTGESFMTDRVLKNCGISVASPFRRENIPAGADVVVYSTAYSAETNVEVAAAMAGASRC